ncbi:MAG: TonB-dependent receptor [Ignavibacteria bacterium]|nr:TonB-dependent receptor [Ignavibacteria bacterium]
MPTHAKGTSDSPNNPSPANSENRGSITGTVRSKGTQSPLPNVSVNVVGSVVGVGGVEGAKTDLHGRYTLRDVPLGIVSVRFSAEGLYSYVATYVAVGADAPAVLDVDLRDDVASDTASVSADLYFGGSMAADLTLTEQEVLRSPASVNDLNRALMILPAVTSVEDATNDLIIRGGSPAETGYYVDGMYMQNISHFPQLGASGGLITILNMDFVRSVDISVRGFSASMGNVMSGIVDIRQRDGRADALHGQLDLNATGFGVNIEGPITASTTILASARKSYVDALIALLNVGDAPNYSDVQGKIVHKFSDDHSMALMGIYGYNNFNRTPSSSADDNFPTFGTENYKQLTAGATFTDIWSTDFSSQTTVNIQSTNAGYAWQRLTDSVLVDSATTTNTLWNLRHVSTLQATSNVMISGGIEFRNIATAQQNLQRSSSANSGFMAAFADVTMGDDNLGAYAGVRMQAYTNSAPLTLDPRLRIWIAPFNKMLFSANAMYVSQTLPTYIALGSGNALSQSTPRCLHLSVQVEYSRVPGERITLSAYSKQYTGMPLAAAAPQSFLFDQVAGTQLTFSTFDSVQTSGTALTNGIELWYQKKLSNNWMANAGVSVFESTYRDWNGEQRDRSFNNRVVAFAQVAWTPTASITVSGRYSLAGGRPYTPIDRGASVATGNEVLNYTLTNRQNLPTYHSLSMRADKRWFYESSSLTVYLSVMNLLNTQNVKGYVWDSVENKIKANPMWGIIPVFGVEFDW